MIFILVVIGIAVTVAKMVITAPVVEAGDQWAWCPGDEVWFDYQDKATWPPGCTIHITGTCTCEKHNAD